MDVVKKPKHLKYDPAAKCPMIAAFLRQFFGAGDKEEGINWKE